MEINMPATSAAASGTGSELDAYKGAFRAEQTKVAAVSTSQQMEVQLMTQEGDRVTISLDARSAALYGAYSTVGADENGAAYQKLELSASLYEREMTFTVEGDLNREERRDILKALKTLDRMMHQFSEGHLKPVLAGARKLQRLETLAGLDATMSVEKQVLVAEQTRMVAVSGSLGADASAPQEPLEDAGTVDQESASPLLAAADGMAEKMARTVAETPTPKDRLMSFVEQLMADYREQMAHFDPMGADVVDRMTGCFHNALARFSGAAHRPAAYMA